MIDSIEITNWKTHKKTTLNFQKGVNVLIGVMGAGKSSTMDAISFGLFGTFPALNSKRVSVSGLITNRPTQQNDAEVKLKFSIDNDEYVVTRKIGESGTTAKLEKNGSHLQTQPTKVTEEIENILKIDYDTFSRVVYAEQNRLDYFLELPKGERKKQIDHMLGLDTFATAEENVTSLINGIKGVVNIEEENLVRTDIISIRKQLKQLLEEKESLQKEQEKIKIEEKRIKESLDSAKKKAEVLKKQFAAKKTISDEVVKLQSRITTLNDEIKKIESLKIDEKTVNSDLAALEKEEKSITQEISDLRSRERAASRALADAEANLKVSQRKATERDKILSEIKGEDDSKTKKEIESANGELDRIGIEIASKKGKIKELNEWMRELNKHISKCPVCERDIPEEMRKTLLESKNITVKSVEEELKKSESISETKNKHIKMLIELQNRIVLANSRLAEFKDIDKIIEKASIESKQAQKNIDEIQKITEKKTKDHESTRKSLDKARSEVQTIERKKSYDAEVKTATLQLGKIKKEFESIDVDEKSVYELQESITKQSASLSDLLSKIQSNDKYITNLVSQAKDKEKSVLDFESMEKRIAKKQAQVLNLNKFKMALIDTEAILRNRLVSSINGLMQNLWPSIYPYGDYTSIRLDAKKDDYLLEINTNLNGSDTWIQVDGVASGGERNIGCLAMRIALAMVVVPNLRWLILDEPTHNIDSTGIAKLIDVFGEELPNVVDQIFIITHDDNLRQIASAKVYQFERDKGAGASTSIVEI